MRMKIIEAKGHEKTTNLNALIGVGDVVSIAEIRVGQIQNEANHAEILVLVLLLLGRQLDGGLEGNDFGRHDSPQLVALNMACIMSISNNNKILACKAVQDGWR